MGDVVKQPFANPGNPPIGGDATATLEEVENQAKAPKKRSKKETDKLLARIKKRLTYGLASESSLRESAKDDDEFYNGKQYPTAIESQRLLDNRPCLVVNKLPQFVKKVTNQIRENLPQMRALPCDDKADLKTAKIITGLLRHIQVNSCADLAYDTAVDQTAIGGYGYFRVRTDYMPGEVDLQEIIIDRIMSRFSVVLDPSRQQPDGSDAKWAFIFEDMLKDVFEQEYPDASAINFSGDDPAPAWITEETVRVAEYMEIESKTELLLLLADGRKVWQSDMDPGDDTPVVSKRDAKRPCVYWYKTNGYEILEETVMPFENIPVVIMIGDEIIVDGKVNYKGIVRNAKDPQRMVNYWWTSYTELVAMAPKAPFIGYVGQFANPEDWNKSNTEPIPFLQVNPMTDGATGTVLPLPQRQQFAGVPTGIERGLSLANDDLRETTGIYNSSLGASSSEHSGVAINARKVEGDTMTFNFSDNLNRSLRYCGRLILQAIPKIYDTERILRIIGEDGQVEKMQPINGAVDPESTNAQDTLPVYDLTVGRYDVVIDSGPSYRSRREEAAQSMMEFIKAFPPAAPLIGDLLAKSQDWPLAQEISERLKTMLPPQIQQQADGQKQLPPEIMAQMQQMQGNLQQAQVIIEGLQKEKDSKTLEQQTKLDIAELDNATKIHIANIQAGRQDDLGLIAQQILGIQQFLEQQHGQAFMAANAQQNPPSPNGAGPESAPQDEQMGQGETAPAPPQSVGSQSVG